MPRASATFMIAHPARWLALGFGSGLSPTAPGTVGTLWAWLVYLLIDRWMGDLSWLVLIALSLAIGVVACTRCAQDLGVADPSSIVWDEIVAFWLVLWWIAPAGFVAQAAAFALFRYFDAAKPGPVGWTDRHFKPAGGPIGWWQGVGIMADDLVAAGCTLFVYAAATFAWRLCVG